MRLERLEARDVPATFDPGFYDPAFRPIPGLPKDIPVRTTVLDADGNGTEDLAVAAGPGGASRVVIYSGGRLNEPLVPSGTPGVLKVPGADDVVGNFYAFEPDFTGGADITSINVDGGPDILVVVPGPGGGPVVVYYVVGPDGPVEIKRFLAFNDPEFRGGLNAERTTFAPEVPALPHQPGIHLLVTPKVGSGGGPVAAVYDAAGDRLAQFLVGPADDRRGVTVVASDVDVALGRRGVAVKDAGGVVRLFDWAGAEFADAVVGPAAGF